MVNNEYDEATRRNFLLTHGKRFVTAQRARETYRATVTATKVGVTPTLPGGVNPVQLSPASGGGAGATDNVIGADGKKKV